MKVKTQKLLAHTIAFGAILLPVIALGHGEVEDGHIEEVVVKTVKTAAGSSALLKSFSPAWWGLLAVSALLTAGLSYGVWKYLQVPLVKKASPEPAGADKTS